MATRRKRVDPRKLHAALGEIDNLKIYRIQRYPGIGPNRGGSRCIACATKPARLATRMKAPEKTNGRPIGIGHWLINTDTQEVIGPFGSECGFRAVMASWLKPRRAQMRQDLLAAGVPRSEIEERLQQFAYQEWKKMLKVYKKAEREAVKLGIDTTTLTYDEIVSAIDAEKKRIAFEREVQYAESLGLHVQKGPKGMFQVNGVWCESRDEVKEVVDKWREAERKKQKQAALAQRTANRAKFPEHQEFLDWALDPANSNVLSYAEERFLEDAQVWIDRGSPWPQTLEKVERIARSKGWQGQLAKLAPAAPQQPQQSSGKLPVCPVCGAALVRRKGYSQRWQRDYDFWGCSQWRSGGHGCKGSMKPEEYERQLKALQGSAAVVPAPPDPSTEVVSCCGKMRKLCTCNQPPKKLSKAARAARKKANGVKTKKADPQPEVDSMSEEELEMAQEMEREKKAKEAFEDRKKKSYWKM